MLTAPVIRLTRRSFIGLTLGALAPRVSTAQAPDKPTRIAYLSGSSQAAHAEFLASFRAGMQDLGYIEGRNLIIEARYAAGRFQRLPGLAGELLALEPDVVFAGTTPASLAAKAATSTVPIVFVGVADPLGVGLVPDLARPGGNITGITNIAAELTGKRLELLKAIVPSAATIAVLINPDDPNASPQMRNAEAAARSLKVQLEPVLPLRSAADLDRAFERAVRAGAGAALRMVDPTLTILNARTIEVAARHRLPVMYPFRDAVVAGGLAAYGASLPAQYRQAATLVHKILKGAKAGELPVEQPTKFELAINLKTASALGLTIPNAVLVRADEIVR